ncbi:MAG: restriction endonuclease subunit S [Cocleimonas sp.]|nr:restriction endonuclease subunit S [Cocleimonas sp.]
MLPDGWGNSTFEEHIDLLSGFAFKSAYYSDSENDIRLLRGDNIKPGSLRWRDAKKWRLEDAQNLERYYLDEGDLIIAMDRTWVSAGLKVAEVKASDLPCLLVQRVSRVRAKNTLIQNLLHQHFSSHRFEQYVKSVQTETAVPHISAKQIKEFSVLIPPLPEQKKIAKILSTWDQSITTTEQLIANSQQQKKALMQQLLTGKKRLAGFSGEWEEAKLDSLFTFLRGKGLSKTAIEKGGENSCILYGELYTKYSEVIERVLSSTDSNDGVESVSGDILLPSSTTTTGIDLANAVALLEDDILLGGDIIIMRPDREKVSSEFFSHLLTHIKKYKIASLAQGITIIHLYGKDLKPLEVSFPTLKEQQKTAQVLSSADQEIETLQQKLNFLKEEKKALMQQLLTGKRRVKLDD